MKRDPFRQLERIRKMREERAASELSRRADALRRAQAELADAKDAASQQAESAMREEHAMLQQLAGHRIERGELFRLHGKLDGFAAKRAELKAHEAELEASAKERARQKDEARSAWLLRQRAAAKIAALGEAWQKRVARRELSLGEVAAEDATPAAAQNNGSRHDD